MSVVTIHQPAYLPWLGYLEKICSADTYVFLDSVQFEKNSFTNRNRIYSADGPLWLTVPVKIKGHLTSTLELLEIDSTKDWKKKHLRSIEQTYARAPYFKERIGRFSEALLFDTPLLSELCFTQLRYWLDVFRISTKVVKSSELRLMSSKGDLVLEICQLLNAKKYISGALGKDYLDLDTFRKAGIELQFQDFVHPIYVQHQNRGDFQPFLAAVDALFNVEDLQDLLRTN